MQVPLTGLGTSHGFGHFDADFSGDSEHIFMNTE